MEFIYLAIAIILETIAIILMKETISFDSFFYGTFIMVVFSLSLYFESLALKSLDLSLTYLIWVGSGLLLVNIYNYLFLNYTFSIFQIFGLFLVSLGMFIFSVN